jgi:preprotein translocase SecE subunit
MNPADKIKGWYQSSKQFYLDVRSEMKKVSWPSRDEVFGTTVIVVACAGIYQLIDAVLAQEFRRVTLQGRKKRL